METRILIPEQLVIVVSSIKKKNINFSIEKINKPNHDNRRKNSRESLRERESTITKFEKPTSSCSRIDLLDSENDEKTTSTTLDFSTSDSNSSSLSSNNQRMSSLSSYHSHSNSNNNSECDSDNNGVPVSSNFNIVDDPQNRNKRKSYEQFKKIYKSYDEIKIYAKQKILCGTLLDPNNGEVQVMSLRGVEPLVSDDIRLVFGCFDRVTSDPENKGNEIRLCNWIRFVSRSFNSFDSRVNVVGKFIERKPIFKFTREIHPNDELVAFFDVGSLNQIIKKEHGDFTHGINSRTMTTTKNDYLSPDAPLDLSKLRASIENLSKLSSEDTEDQEHQNFPCAPEKYFQQSNSFSLQNILQPMTMKLFQPHLYSPPGSSSLSASTTTNATLSLSSPGNSISALTSPNSNSISHLSLLGGGGRVGNVGLLRPILRTRGRERSLLPCDVCGKAFDRPSLLKRHMRTHTGEKPHICDVCNKGFSTSSSLNTHRRIHSGEKPHQCPMCGKRFTASSNLYYHKMTHNKEKPHKCQLCGKSFPTPGDLKSHQYVHSGSWPYNCHICHRGFSKQTNLRNHLLLHSGDKPHSCQICGKKFALACNLRAHVRTHEEDPVTSCVSCKRTFLTSLNMLVNGQCRPCILHLQTPGVNINNGNNNTQKNNSHSEMIPIVKMEPQQHDTILPPSQALLHAFHLPPSHPHSGLFHGTFGFNNGRPNPFLEQLFEWNWRFAKETAGNLGLMQQKLIESQMLAAQLMSVSNSSGISDILRFRPTGLQHSNGFNGLQDGLPLNKFTP